MSLSSGPAPMRVSPPTARLWIKICGLTTPDAVDAALANNVDAVGFVFAESARRLAPARAAALASPVRGRALCVAVMRRPTQADVDHVIADFAPDVLQTDLRISRTSSCRIRSSACACCVRARLIRSSPRVCCLKAR